MCSTVGSLAEGMVLGAMDHRLVCLGVNGEEETCLRGVNRSLLLPTPPNTEFTGTHSLRLLGGYPESGVVQSVHSLPQGEAVDPLAPKL